MTKRENKRKIEADYQKKEAKQKWMDKGPREVREVEAPRELNENIIEGRNPVIEAFETKLTIEKLLVTKGDVQGSITKILAMAKERNIPIIEADKRRLDSVANTPNHQGVIAYVTPYIYRSIEDLLQIAKDRNEDPFIILLDEIEDPHNLGSIIRTAELTGAHGVVIPKRRSVGVNSTVFKTSAGAVNYMAVAKVTNLARTIDELKEKGLFIYGGDMDAKSKSYNTNFSGGVALVIGNEGKGLSRLVKEKCDDVVSIPMAGKLNSLNASVAAGILMYEVMTDRIKKNK